MANSTTISTTVINGLEARGIILPDYLIDNLPAVVQLFIALSSPLRSSVRAFLTSLLGQLKLSKAMSLTQIGQCDALAQRVNTASAIVNETLAPVDKLLSSMPVDSALGMSPDLAVMLKKIADLAPIKIPPTFFLGGSGFDMFEGINSYADLRKKANDLAYQTVQAASASYYAQTADKVIDDRLTEVEEYLYILDTLDADQLGLDPRSLSVDTGSTIIFPPTRINTPSYLYASITNQSTSPCSIGGTYSLSGSSRFMLANSAITTFLLATSGSSLDIVLKFIPLTTDFVSGTLSIVHDAGNIASPVVVSLSGIGT